MKRPLSNTYLQVTILSGKAGNRLQNLRAPPFAHYTGKGLRVSPAGIARVFRTCKALRAMHDSASLQVSMSTW